ncbi:polysaccharide deacetylase family protein [Candidatus Venteria ishoeyi]|uniref:Polysaccharide deacetylase n=1 Tax=Candidatus Venteria ishoeyi TaxID=1899563 RepID=A0A1H6FBA2_9GAMM|nr:polysaccharide deacetylase family protein [Candidatus Venteria ishoeyi]MDM8548194.1 polysaccharide deacetylase family protein [Candidatus Venteria ishoeyi]SEH06275.1 Polysaccharide deacetylase [Candidatus Venteria ishoeyi]
MLANPLLQLWVSLLYFIFVLKLWRGLKKLLGLRTPARCISLCYHEVTQTQQALFKQQMLMLKKLATPVFADAVLPDDGQLYVAVTFDDGFVSLIDHALPILRELEIPCVLFIPSGCLGQTPPWLQDSSHPTAQLPIMTPQQLQSLDRQWVRIASHSVSHADLSALDETALSTELQQSREDLQQLLNTPINLLAFPYGRFNHLVLEIARKVGYQRVYAADPLLHSDDFLWDREDLYPEIQGLTFRLKISGAYDWLPVADAWIRKIKGR